MGFNSRDERVELVREHHVVMGYDQHESTHDRVAYSSIPVNDGIVETTFIPRRLAAEMGEPLIITVTVQPGDRLGDHHT